VKRLYDMLDLYNKTAVAERAGVEARIWSQLGCERATMVLDMSGFSLITRTRGLIHYLAMVRRMHHITQPIVEDNGGELVKYEADNLYAFFPSVAAATVAAAAIHAAAAAEDVPDGQSRIRVSIGIAWGKLLSVPGADFFGDCVNVAAKLGEDIAGPAETLLSAEARDQLPADTGFAFEELNLSVSGLALRAWKLR